MESMLLQNIMTLSDSVGRVVSPAIKLILLVFEVWITVRLLQKYRQRKNSIALGLLLMFTCFTLATLFSSFDVLFNWQNWLGDNTFLGMGLAFLMSGLAVTFYLYVIIEVFYGKSGWEPKHKLFFLMLSVGLIGSTTIALILRLSRSSAAFYFTALYMVLALAMVILMLKNSLMIAGRVHEQEYKARFGAMAWSAIFLFAMLIFFVIDSLYEEFTIYSLIGWASVALALYFSYRGYI